MSTDAVGEKSGAFETPRLSPASSASDENASPNRASTTRQDPPPPPPPPPVQDPAHCPVCQLIFNHNDACQGEGVCAIIKSEEDSPAAFVESFQTLLTHIYANNMKSEEDAPAAFAESFQTLLTHIYANNLEDSGSISE